MTQAREFPASDLKLLKLRREGTIPLSYELLSCAAIAGACLSALLLSSLFWRVFAEHYASSGEGFTSAGLETTLQLFSNYFPEALIMAIAPVLGSVIVLGAIQTRFLFTLKPLGSGFSSFFLPPSFLSRASLGDSVTALLAVFAWLLPVVLIVGAIVTEWSAHEKTLALERHLQAEMARVFEPLPTPKSSTLSEALVIGERQVYTIFAVASGFTLFVALLSLFLVRLRFGKEHSMTRAELEQEMREEELSPEVRQSMRERQRTIEEDDNG